MTTYNNSYSRPNVGPLIIALLLLAAVVYGVHAIIQHGNDAEKVRQCMEDKGPFAIWLAPDGCTTHNLVKLDGKREVGDQVKITTEQGEFEKTSFIPRMGKLERIIDWLTKKGCVECSLPK